MHLLDTGKGKGGVIDMDLQGPLDPVRFFADVGFLRRRRCSRFTRLFVSAALHCSMFSVPSHLISDVILHLPLAPLAFLRAKGCVGGVTSDKPLILQSA